jgi:Flp pilus assembly protein TadG
MAIELVVLVPILLLVLMLVVAAGRLVSIEGQVEAASRDAVRAATLERDARSAANAAAAAVQAAPPNGLSCERAKLTGRFEAGEVVTVTVSCQVSWSDLSSLGLPGTKTVTASSSAPLDVYRRTGTP